MGYRRIPENSRIEMLHHSFLKVGMGEQICIEVHHRLVKEVFMTNSDLGEIWTNDFLPIEYGLVYLSWHGIRHGITRLLWLCEIAEIMKIHMDSIKWNIVKEMSTNYNVQKQFMFIKYLASVLLMTSLWNNVHSPFSNPQSYILGTLFINLQLNIINQEGEKTLRNLLGMCLMKMDDLKVFIPKYLRYRVTY
jgi:hypothetical protein